MKHKKIARIIIIIVCLLLALSQVLFVFAQDNSDNERIILNIYDDISQESILSNTSLAIHEDYTVNDSLLDLKKNKEIKDFRILNGEIISITSSSNISYRADTSSTGSTFTVKVNGDLITSKNENGTKLQNGNIVEIFYTVNSEDTNPTTSIDIVAPPATPKNTAWNEHLIDTTNNAFDWLKRHIETSDNYLLVACALEKSANQKHVSEFANSIISGKEYTTSSELTNDILLLTLCGFDASSEKYRRLIHELSIFQNTNNSDIFFPINALIAYDSNSYPPTSNAINSRDNLVNSILSLQLPSGGFSKREKLEADIYATAMALVALAPYEKEYKVSNSISNGISFLAENYANTNGFESCGSQSLTNLTSLIVALNSVGIPIDDPMFQIGEITSIENLLTYYQEDSAFSDSIGGKSSIEATEQALIALASIKKMGSPYVLQNPIQIDTTFTPTENVPIANDDTMVYMTIAILLGIISITTIIFLIITRSNPKN